MRWALDFNYFKNTADCRSLYQQDYYKVQGLSVIMIVNGLIHQEFSKACENLKEKSVKDCLLEARMVKINKKRGIWTVANCRKKQLDLFKALNTTFQI
ncbi:MAG: hypothetical protein ACOX3T_05220 [Bdellovibrionota bacterium]